MVEVVCKGGCNYSCELRIVSVVTFAITVAISNQDALHVNYQPLSASLKVCA